MSSGLAPRRSRRPSGRRPGLAPPEFLVDRSLGRYAVPEGLRAEGLIVHTLADVYGEELAQQVDDTGWITLAAERDWAVLCKDDRIRRRPAERQAVESGGVRAFCVTNAQLKFPEQAAYFVANRFRIIQASRKPGPFLYGVYRDHIGPLWP